jgi:dihydrodipicolinate synthase/N-acetylneuraminate lyase
MIFNSPVYPIPPSFINGKLDKDSIKKYVTYIGEKGGKHIMSTAGTSQFNLMSVKEIRELNLTLSVFDGNVILGLPEMSLDAIKFEIQYLNDKLKDKTNIYLLILFSERYYNDSQIVSFFEDVCSKSNFPIMVHGNGLRKGYGGIYEYDNKLLKKLSEINNFIGMKEESSTINYAIENLKDLNLEIIVAGGSMRRFWCLEPFGATSYLTGVGSFNPEIEERFYENYINGNLIESKKIMVEKELPLFKQFMSIGWHASMREALKNMGYIKENRKPFVEISNEEKIRIQNEINKIL